MCSSCRARQAAQPDGPTTNPLTIDARLADVTAKAQSLLVDIMGALSPTDEHPDRITQDDLSTILIALNNWARRLNDLGNTEGALEVVRVSTKLGKLAEWGSKELAPIPF